MATIKKAKIASAKQGSRKYYYEGKEVDKVKMIGSLVGLKSYTAVARADNGELIRDEKGIPLNWHQAPLKNEA